MKTSSHFTSAVVVWGFRIPSTTMTMKNIYLELYYSPNAPNLSREQEQVFIMYLLFQFRYRWFKLCQNCDFTCFVYMLYTGSWVGDFGWICTPVAFPSLFDTICKVCELQKTSVFNCESVTVLNYLYVETECIYVILMGFKWSLVIEILSVNITLSTCHKVWVKCSLFSSLSNSGLRQQHLPQDYRYSFKLIKLP